MILSGERLIELITHLLFYLIILRVYIQRNLGFRDFKHVRQKRKAFVHFENVSILTSEDNMKVFQRYLCELCTNSIARQRGQDEFEFMVCAVGANGFTRARGEAMSAVPD
jgi:hypothetical protein